MPMRTTMVRPIQYAEKLPAVRPESTFSDGPPSRKAVTTSRTCCDSVEVKTLTNSGMIAPARVPQLMIVESFHHSVSLPPMCGMTRYETTKVRTSETIEVIQTSDVSGASKFIVSALP